MEKVFNYNDAQIRIVTQNDEIWFAGIDVCNILGYADAHQKIKSLDEDEYRLDRITDGQGKQKETLTVNESGFYTLVLTSSKPEAKLFRRWVTHNVLPAIRKSGKYTTEQEKAKDIELQLVIKDINTKKTELNRLRTEINNIKSKILKSEKRRDEIITNYNPQLPFPTEE